MKVYIARTKNEKGVYWVMFDAQKVMPGKIGETKDQIITRWKAKHGNIDHLTRFTGMHRQAELAMTVAHIQRESKAEKPSESSY